MSKYFPTVSTKTVIAEYTTDNSEWDDTDELQVHNIISKGFRTIEQVNCVTPPGVSKLEPVIIVNWTARGSATIPKGSGVFIVAGEFSGLWPIHRPPLTEEQRDNCHGAIMGAKAKMRYLIERIR